MTMSNPAYYREQAAKCQRLAQETNDVDKAKMLALARDYLKLADMLEGSPKRKTPEK